MAVYSISYYCTEIYSSLAFPCTVKFGTLGRVGGMLCNHVARYKPHVGQNYFSIRCWMVVEFEFELRAPNIPIRMLGIRNEHRLNNLCPAPINNMQKSECVQLHSASHIQYHFFFVFAFDPIADPICIWNKLQLPNVINISEISVCAIFVISVVIFCRFNKSQIEFSRCCHAIKYWWKYLGKCNA